MRHRPCGWSATSTAWSRPTRPRLRGRRGSPPSAVGAPVAKARLHLDQDVRVDVALAQLTKLADRHPQLLQMHLAHRAQRDVLLEAGMVDVGQGALEVVGDQLDEVLAGQGLERF